ncbi:putative holin-like toxin [Sporolactobacillus sp. STSJ-5]
MSGYGSTLVKGGGAMTVFQSLTLMISFGVLVLMLSNKKK